MKDNQKKVPAKRIQLVDVVLERKGLQLFSGRLVRSPHNTSQIIRDFIGDSDREKFVVLCLSTKNEPTAMEVVHTGGINSSLVEISSVFKVSKLSNAKSIIVSHCHPSGHIEPSIEDIEVTKRLIQAGEILSVHIILGHNQFLSLKDKGYI